MTQPVDLQCLSSGIEGLDRILEGPHWADTVLFCLSDRREYKAFVEPLADGLNARGIPVHCVRFTEGQISIGLSTSIGLRFHDLFSTESPDELCDRLDQLFEADSTSTFYVFDDLSPLLSLSNHDNTLVKLVRRIHLGVSRRQAAAYVAVEKGEIPAQVLAGLKDSVSICVNVWSVDG